MKREGMSDDDSDVRIDLEDSVELPIARKIDGRHGHRFLGQQQGVSGCHGGESLQNQYESPYLE